jgi:hypothetical protein
MCNNATYREVHISGSDRQSGDLSDERLNDRSDKTTFGQRLIGRTVLYHTAQCRLVVDM